LGGRQKTLPPLAKFGVFDYCYARIAAPLRSADSFLDRPAAAGEDRGADAALILDDAPQYPVDMDLRPRRLWAPHHDEIRFSTLILPTGLFIARGVERSAHQNR